MRSDEEVLEILREAKKLAQRYRVATGKPLGITGEVAEYEAAQILNVELTPARQAGYDAVEKANGGVRRLQIKGRCLLPNCKPGQRLGSIHIHKDGMPFLWCSSMRTLTLPKSTKLLAWRS